jgi:rod shape-determining protein MreC
VLDSIQRTGARPRIGLLFIAVLVGHVILISSQVHSRTGVPVLESVTFGAFARVQTGIAGLVRGVRDAWGSYVDLRGARAENDALRARLAELEIRLQEQRTLAQRSERLQALLDLKPAVTAPTLAANVVAGYVNPDMLTVTIDKGASDGVLENMAVMAPAGVVGRVVGPVAAHAARVQLLIDQNAAAGAVVERTRAGGMIVGHEGDPPLRMTLVSNLADVQPGDLVVTSGADGIYPKGFNIGRVESSERGKQLYREITVRPLADFRSLEEVLVVLLPARPAEPAGASAAGPAR